MIEYVELERARTAPGVRMVVTNVVPSPWGEAAKAVFRLAGVSVLAVRSQRGNAAQDAWTHAHNVPVVFHDDEPPRTVWSQIVALADRLARPGTVLPVEIDRRIRTMGLLHELAGENGLGWSARLLMIHASLTEGRGFPRPVGQYLAAKYGYAPEAIDAARAQAIAILSALAAELGDAAYFGGASPNALDGYAATFLTPASPITEEQCPAMAPALRVAFGVAAEQLEAHLPATLRAHRDRMFAQHLALPIVL
jgi:glutathione S-transferase